MIPEGNGERLDGNIKKNQWRITEVIFNTEGKMESNDDVVDLGDDRNVDPVESLEGGNSNSAPDFSTVPERLQPMVRFIASKIYPFPILKYGGGVQSHYHIKNFC